MSNQHSIMLGKVWHRRLTPVEHDFTYPLAMVLVDLDDVDGFVRSHPLLGKRFRPLTLRDRDFVDHSDIPVATKVRDKARELGQDFSSGRLLMLAQMRGLGWQFNPLVTYWHFPPGASRPVSALAEVRNTPWHERHWYALGGNDGEALTFFRHEKGFHVSPFMSMELVYQWEITWEDPLRIKLSALRDAEPLFQAGMCLYPSQLSEKMRPEGLWPLLLQGPRTSLGIHFQALRLWRKGVPFHPHPGRTTRQGGR